MKPEGIRLPEDAINWGARELMKRKKEKKVADEGKPVYRDVSQEVAVRKGALLESIRANRENHRREFELALEGWHDRAVEELGRMRDDLSKHKNVSVSIHLPRPEDHTKDYDRAIKMLEMEIEDTVIIPTEMFAQFVQDDWSWKAGWTTSNAAYVGTALSKFKE